VKQNSSLRKEPASSESVDPESFFTVVPGKSCACLIWSTWAGGGEPISARRGFVKMRGGGTGQEATVPPLASGNVDQSEKQRNQGQKKTHLFRDARCFPPTNVRRPRRQNTPTRTSYTTTTAVSEPFAAGINFNTRLRVIPHKHEGGAKLPVFPHKLVAHPHLL